MSKRSFLRTTLAVNVLTGTKNSWNLNESTLALLTDKSRMNWVGKFLSHSDRKF